MKNRSTFSLFFTLCLLVFSGCFQPVEFGETYVEKGTAYLRVTNDSEETDYILEGLELRNAAGEVEQSWDGLALKQGETWEVHTETTGSCTLWYRVKDTWISSSVIAPYKADPPVRIALNKSHEVSFKGEKLDITWQDNDNDGFPDAWETENGFNPEDPADGHEVYVRADGEDTEDTYRGTLSNPYRTLAKAVSKAERGLTPEARTVVVLNTLTSLNGNDQNPENQARPDSVFYLGKTRNPITMRGKDTTDPNKPGILMGPGTSGKRVLYLDSGADVTLLNITITGGKYTGGGIYATGAKLTLGKGTKVTGNESADLGTGNCGGVYMERGELVMEKESFVTGNSAAGNGGVSLTASKLTMRGGAITGNKVKKSIGGLGATDSTIDMFEDAELSNNEVGTEVEPTGNNVGGVALSYSTLIMHTGSKISGNKVYGLNNGGTGGGLYTSGESFVTMEGGSEISWNECPLSAGIAGGIHLGGRTIFKMTGGRIVNNTAGGQGGGIVVSGNVIGGTSFTMTGGSITGNTAGVHGGGIYLYSGSSFTKTGGFVYGNSGSPNQNIAGTPEATDTGHAIYDARTETKKPYNGDITRFPLP
jgi:hypothetical protein